MLREFRVKVDSRARIARPRTEAISGRAASVKASYSGLSSARSRARAPIHERNEFIRVSGSTSLVGLSALERYLRARNVIARNYCARTSGMIDAERGCSRNVRMRRVIHGESATKNNEGRTSSLCTFVIKKFYVEIR